MLKFKYQERTEYSVNDDIHSGCLISTTSNDNGYYYSGVFYVIVYFIYPAIPNPEGAIK